MKTLEKMKKKKNNKGFSLVELIIVMAIMAILVGIVGSQVIPYIEKSKESKDIQILSTLCTDAMTAFSTNAETLDPTKTYTITIKKAATTIDDAGAAKVLTTFTELNKLDATHGVSTLKLSSKKGKALETTDITVVYDGTSGITVKAKGFDDIKTVN